MITLNPGDNLQGKIDTSSPGDVLAFAGQHTLASPLRLRGGRTYRAGELGRIVHRMGEHAFVVRESGLAVRSLVFDGPGIRIEQEKGQQITDITVDDCTFSAPKINDHSQCGIIFESDARLVRSRITNNLFKYVESMGAAAIYGYYWDDLLIANNEFIDGTEGIHLIDHSKASKGLLIEQNYFGTLRRMGIELQGGGIDTIVQDNWYDTPRLSNNANENADTDGYSIVCPAAINPITRRNVALMKKSSEYPDKIGPRMVFELGGQNLLCEHNYSDGGNHVVAVNGTNATGIVRNNLIKNFREGPRNSNGARIVFENNGANVALPVDLIARGRPYRNKRYGQAPIPPPDPETPPPATRPSVHLTVKGDVELIIERTEQ